MAGMPLGVETVLQLSPGVTSENGPGGTATQAVLESGSGAVAYGGAVPVIVKVRLPPPRMFTGPLMVFPLPAASPRQLLPAVGVQVQVTPLNPVAPDGMLSVTVAPMASNAPWLLTTSW